MLKETETKETVVFFVTFLSLVAFQLGGGPLGSPRLRLCCIKPREQIAKNVLTTTYHCSVFCNVSSKEMITSDESISRLTISKSIAKPEIGNCSDNYDNINCNYVFSYQVASAMKQQRGVWSLKLCRLSKLPLFYLCLPSTTEASQRSFLLLNDKQRSS